MKTVDFKKNLYKAFCSILQDKRNPSIHHGKETENTIRIIDFIILCNQEYETKTMGFGIGAELKSQICHLVLGELGQATYHLEVSDSSSM